VSNPHRVDGLAVEVQQPNHQKEELAYLQMTRQENYDQMEAVRERLLELLHYHHHQLSYRKRTEMAVDIVRQIEAVKRHFCLSCVAQLSALQSASCRGQNSERFNFANDHQQTIGQRLYFLSHEAVQQVVEFTQSLMNQGKSVEQIMEVLMPTLHSAVSRGKK
jgi:uncharacterized protein YoaH (UPF0181 family)